MENPDQAVFIQIYLQKDETVDISVGSSPRFASRVFRNYCGRTIGIFK